MRIMAREIGNSNILPEDWIDDSLENYLYHHTTKSHIIYVVVVLAVSAALISLPFIYVDITVNGSGIIRPTAERSTITAPVSEIVDSVFVHEGDKLVKGQPVLRFRTSSEDTKIVYQKDLRSDLNEQYHDLCFLAKGIRPKTFQSSVRQQEYLSFLSQREQAETDLNQYRVEWQRNKKLFDKMVISEEEYNKYLYQYQDKINELKTLVQNKLSTWQTDRNNLLIQRNEATSNIIGNEVDKDLYTVRSPIAGTIEQFNGIYRGLSLQTGTQIAVISPNSSPYLEVYVEPKNIAFIHVGMPVKVQVESFNYNEWGTIDGKVSKISSDYIVDNNNNYLFKIKVKLLKDYLEMKSTKRRGYIKKGMTAIAHFVVTRQSLFELLYKNIDNWMNPTQYKSNEDKKQE